MKEKKERNKAIRRWRKKGFTYSYIGNLFNMSRQCAHQIDHKKKPSIWRLLWNKLRLN